MYALKPSAIDVFVFARGYNSGAWRSEAGKGREGAPSRNYAHFFTEIDATSALGGGGSSWWAKGGGKRGGEENMDINADAIKYGYIDYLFLCPVFFARAAAPLHHPADRTDGPCSTVCVFSPLAPV